jgi:signal transduction histidine kinase
VSAGIIHQLGQPLSGIGANLAVVLPNLETCEAKSCGTLEIMRDINADVVRLREILIHLRALAKPIQVLSSQFDFNKVVDSVLGLLRHEAGSRRIAISYHLSPGLPPVHGDFVQLSQVILNLGCNALDACADSPPERRAIAITTRCVDDGSIELCVRDSGNGLSPEVVERLFTPFFTTKPEGLGMGLRLCRTIVQAHGGSIDGSNNRDGPGASFLVVLPAYSEFCYTKG